MTSSFTFEKGVNVASDAPYPYTAQDGTCKTSYSTAIPQGDVTGCKSVGGLFGAQAADVKSALMLNRVSIAFKADQFALQHSLRCRRHHISI